jgi:hypothetical protein
MLTHHQRPVCLSLMSTDLPILNTIEAAATLYEKEQGRFHLLINRAPPETKPPSPEQTNSKQLLWLELSSSRVILTLQGNSQFSYRHFWERGVHGISRYWLNEGNQHLSNSFRLRNFTRDLTLTGHPLPEFLRIEYELWTGQVYFGHYVLHLEIYH